MSDSQPKSYVVRSLQEPSEPPPQEREESPLERQARYRRAFNALIRAGKRGARRG